jgi:hypothetical protein
MSSAISTSTPTLVATKKRKSCEPIDEEKAEVKEEKKEKVEAKQGEIVEKKIKTNESLELNTVQDFIKYLEQMPKNLMILSPSLSKLTTSRCLVNCSKPGFHVKSVDNFSTIDNFNCFQIPTPLLNLCDLKSDSDEASARKSKQQVIKDVAIATAKSILQNDEKLLDLVKELLIRLGENNYTITEHPYSDLLDFQKLSTLHGVVINRYETFNSRGRVTSVATLNCNSKHKNREKQVGAFVSSLTSDNGCPLYIDEEGKVCEISALGHSRTTCKLLYNTCATKIDDTTLLRSVSISVADLEKLAS